MSSGGAISPPSDDASVVTTMITPSSASLRRSRSATSWTSPTRRPSTNVTPDSTRVDDPRTAPSQLDDRAVLGDEDALLGHAGLAGELRVGGEHAVLAVDGHDVTGAQEREHRPQLLLARVTGDVYGCDLLVEHLRARAGELVDRVVDTQLVPGNRLRRDDDGVSRLDRDGLVVAVRDSRQAPTSARPGFPCRERGAGVDGSCAASSGLTIASSGNET